MQEGQGEQQGQNLPAYERDDGPLTDDEWRELQIVAAAASPKGSVVRKQSLFCVVPAASGGEEQRL